MIHRANSNPCGKCRTAKHCVVEHQPPCNMIMVAWRDEAAQGMMLVSLMSLKNSTRLDRGIN